MARSADRNRRVEDDRFTAALAGLAMALFLAVIGLYLIQALSVESKLEDCVLQGRMNCTRIELSPVASEFR